MWELPVVSNRKGPYTLQVLKLQSYSKKVFWKFLPILYINFCWKLLAEKVFVCVDIKHFFGVSAVFIPYLYNSNLNFSLSLALDFALEYHVYCVYWTYHKSAARFWSLDNTDLLIVLSFGCSVYMSLSKCLVRIVRCSLRCVWTVKLSTWTVCHG